jgi:hypothetical protein
MKAAGQEHRVTWQRQGYRKKSRLFQTAAAAERHALVLQGRLAEAYPDKDPEDLACCSGFECGCGGLTNAEAWAREHARFPPLILGPWIERRDVGAWERTGICQESAKTGKALL